MELTVTIQEMIKTTAINLSLSNDPLESKKLIAVLRSLDNSLFYIKEALNLLNSK